jgi:hypothetical protein
MLPKLNERFVIDADGKPVEVILPIADYHALLTRLMVLEVSVEPLPDWETWSAEFRQALADAGYTTREQILELTREVKREQLDERLALR